MALNVETTDACTGLAGGQVAKGVSFVAGTEGIDVQLGELGDFAMKLGGDREDFMGELSQIFTELPHLGRGGLMEAGYAAALNGHRLEDAGWLMMDAGIGAATLATGALAIACNYMNSDAAAAATVNDVNAAFTAPPGQSGSAQADPAADPSPRANNPDGLPDPTDTTPDAVATDDSAQSDAERRVEANREQYGERQDYIPDPRVLEAIEAAERAAAAERAEAAAAGSPYYFPDSSPNPPYSPYPSRNP